MDFINVESCRTTGGQAATTEASTDDDLSGELE